MFFKLFNLIYNTSYAAWFIIRSLFYIFHTVLPFGVECGIVGMAAYFLTKLKKPDNADVYSIFGPEPWSKEAELNPEKLVTCIAHRGAALDAPENTMEAFKYCIQHNCKFIEIDVRSSKDGKLVLLHDAGLQRIAQSDISDIHYMDWDQLKDININSNHPNSKSNSSQFKEVRLCLLDEALDFLEENNCRVIIDVKGRDQNVIKGILDTFEERPYLYSKAAVTCFNPWILYKIRKANPRIVGAISYRPYCFSAEEFDAEIGPVKPKFYDFFPFHALLRGCDTMHFLLWRFTAVWCSVSAVFLHKDLISPYEVVIWRKLGVRCCGWCVNRPIEKLYYRGVLKSPYLAKTLLAEPDSQAQAQTEEKFLKPVTPLRQKEAVEGEGSAEQMPRLKTQACI